mmetsp:Transcript_34321/g.86135  ORF Transcript_34321/g.86135 Transcript_34321/m.86135 type:complete len:242 (+) Transcript_34321:399-1124(+)
MGGGKQVRPGAHSFPSVQRPLRPLRLAHVSEPKSQYRDSAEAHMESLVHGCPAAVEGARQREPSRAKSQPRPAAHRLSTVHAWPLVGRGWHTPSTQPSWSGLAQRCGPVSASAHAWPETGSGSHTAVEKLQPRPVAQYTPLPHASPCRGYSTHIPSSQNSPVAHMLSPLQYSPCAFFGVQRGVLKNHAFDSAMRANRQTRRGTPGCRIVGKITQGMMKGLLIFDDSGVSFRLGLAGKSTKS